MDVQSAMAYFKYGTDFFHVPLNGALCALGQHSLRNMLMSTAVCTQAFGEQLTERERMQIRF